MNTNKVKLPKSELAQIFKEQEAHFLGGWRDFLAFPSISADPAYDNDCVSCANWLVAEIMRCGGRAELFPTSTKPTVFGEFVVSPEAPTVIYYGHYDVQPTDPNELWKSPPFEATVRDGRLYARGAQDNKGQTFYVLKALETLHKAGALRVNVRLFIEGEEESGSTGISESLLKWREKLRGDVLMVCDTGTPVPGVPAVTMGLRGIYALTVTARGPKADLHSGVFGGVVRNPVLELARILAAIHDDQGRIRIPGYYDEVRTYSAEEKALINDPVLSLERVEGYLGVPAAGGESGFSWSERRGVRPTIEVNGIHGGYGGPGSKTVIPAEAVAKITGRVVADQDPQRCLELLSAYICGLAPKGISITISEAEVHGRALVLSGSSPWATLARDVLMEISPSGKVLSVWEGGSVPIVAEISRVAEIEPLLVGFGYDVDAMHSPNESFSLEQFKLGFLYAALLLQRIGDGVKK